MDSPVATSTPTFEETSSNLCQQLMKREMGIHQQQYPQTFASHLFRERFRIAKNLYKTDLRAHYGCVNAIEFSNGGNFLASGGDDKRVLIWNLEKAINCQGSQARPRILQTEHTSNIFCLGFDRFNQRVFSGGNDDLVIVHEFETGKLCNVYKHDSPIYGLSIDPQSDSIFATAGEDGQILLFDQRMDASDPFVVAQLRSSFHAVEFHPAGGNFLVTANSKRGAAFWDIRKPHHPVIQYGYIQDPSSCMSVRFNTTGSLILALRRRLPPILYNTQSSEPVCTFYHGKYYNSCTMKSCTFAGEDDEWVLSGSDDFNLYVWRVSDVDLERTDQWIESTQIVLYGHRSIVNQVRYNRQKCLLASSGVEKIIKLWSPFAQKSWSGSLEESACNDNPRDLYSPYSFSSLSTPPHSWSHMSHDYSNRNTNEDPRMMAFFDSLIQQEIEGWETNYSSTECASNTSSNDSSESSTNEQTDTDSDDSNDDNDDGNDGGIVVNHQHHNSTVERNAGKRSHRLVRRKDHKRRHSTRRKIKVQRHKYPNRIAYLIATKRNTLRRLAIKGASVSNRHPHKIIKVCNHSKTTPSSSSRSHRSKRFPKNSAAICTSSAVASTSAAAAGTSSLHGYRNQRRKYKKNHFYETSSDDNDEVASSSNRFNSLNVPSTSTGITSSLKDNIIRLRRQQQHIIDSDEDDDDDDENERTPASNNRISSPTEIAVDRSVQPTKKLNGVRRTNDSADRRDRRSTINTFSNQGVTSSSTTSSTNLPQANGNGINGGNRRRPPTTTSAFAYTDNYSSHSNSRLSMSYSDDLQDSSASSSNEMNNSDRHQAQQQVSTNPLETTPLKKRKLAIADYINKRNNNQEENDRRNSEQLEENNNEQNNNNTICPPNCHMNLEQASTSSSAAGSATYNNTPDSGVSISTLTPSHTDDDVSIRYGSSGSRHVLQNTNSQTAVHVFQQKVARVRRNYRKKFADDSDSD